MSRPAHLVDPVPGGFTVDQIRPGSRYELSNGHPIYCAPSGGGHGSATSAASLVLGTDPSVDQIGTDVGYTSRSDKLRAPDISVGNVPARPGFVAGAPRLALEIADSGQDKADLKLKIAELLEGGAEQVWVLQLVGPRRVDVWRSDGSTQTFSMGEYIPAPGVFSRPVLVESLYDPEIAREVALSNLLARYGYSDLDAVRQEGRQEGVASGALSNARTNLRAVAQARGLVLRPDQEAAIDAATDLATLEGWIKVAAVATRGDALIT